MVCVWGGEGKWCGWGGSGVCVCVGGGAGYKHDNYSLVLTHLHFVIGFHK